MSFQCKCLHCQAIEIEISFVCHFEKRRLVVNGTYYCKLFLAGFITQLSLKQTYYSSTASPQIGNRFCWGLLTSNLLQEQISAGQFEDAASFSKLMMINAYRVWRLSIKAD